MKITTELLREWEACRDGYNWFIHKFPQGADYGVVQQALRADGRTDDSSWLTGQAFGYLLVDPASTGDITADAKVSSDELIKQTAISVEVEKVDGVSPTLENDNDGDSARIGSSGYSARIGSSGYSARIGSSGYYAQIGSSGDSAQIGSSGDSAQIGSSGYYAQIGSSGYYAQIGSSGDSAQIGSSGDSAQIGSSGDSAQIGSSGDSAQIGSSGDSARIGSSGNSAQIGSSGNSAQIVATGNGAIIAIAGFNAQFKVGLNGAVSAPYRDAAGRARFVIGYEGENLKCDVWYRVNDAGQFEEVETGEPVEVE
jgi:hypothetical protein